MSKHKKILLSLSETQLQEIRKELKKGYMEIGMVNLRIAEDCLTADNLQLETYLEMLSECE